MSSGTSLPSKTTQPVNPNAKAQVKKVESADVPPAKNLSPKIKQVQQTQFKNAVEEEEWGEDDSFFDKLRSMSAAWLFSMIFHLILLLTLGLYTLTQISDKGPIFLTAGETSENIDDLIEVPLNLDSVDVEEFDPSSELLDEAQDTQLVSEVAPELPAVKATTLSDFGSLSDALETELGGSVAGLGDALTSGGKPTLFTNGGPKAKTVVYIVDNSNSMTGRSPRSAGYGRMETALVELAKSINSLDESQQFYIIFYSDTAYGTFFPKTAKGYVYATKKNKKRVGNWLNTVECCFFTRANKAFEMARKLKPELIYLLGDGAFGDGSDKRLVKNPIKGARLEALGMNLSGRAAESFKALAKAHGGKYRDVGLTEDGREILAQFGPRKGNNVKGPVWGVELPLTLQGLQQLLGR